MKKLFFASALFLLCTFTSNAQYDILSKSSAYNQNDIAYGAPNTYDHQFDRKDDYRRGDNNGRMEDRRNSNYGHHGCKNGNNRPSTNMRNSIVIQKFEIDRRRKDRVELEIYLKGPDNINTFTKWRGNTLYVYVDYPYSRNNEFERSVQHIDLGRLSPKMQYNVVVLDTNTNTELGEYVIR